MKYDLCNTEYKQLLTAWNMFIDTGTVPAGSPPDTYTSWIRCSHEGIYQIPLSPAQRTKKQEINIDLLNNAKQVLNVIDNILNKILRSEYAVLLFDAEGEAIDLICKGNEIISWVKHYSETYATLNVIDIARKEKRAIEVYGYEHHYPGANDWHSIAAPIFDFDENVAGGLCIVFRIKQVPPELIPIVIIGSQSIQSRFILDQIAKHQIGILLEDISDPVVVVNEQGDILNANQRILDLLNVPLQNLLGRKVTNFITYETEPSGIISSFDGLADVKNVYLNINNRSISSQIKKSIVGHYDQHPLILLSLKNSRIKNKSISTARSDNDELYSFADLVGESTSIKKVKFIAQKSAKSSSNVLIEGESGTGKELIAQSIHKSSRPSGQFIAINCGALTKDILQSELFGYVEGAFTGAKKGGKPGRIELANEGTLFLDEIGEMPLDMQVSLLRFLQDRIVIPVGAGQGKKVNVRVIAATNRDLYNEMLKGNFREDLYYRLNVIEIRMPSLRERVDDIPLLSRHILNRICFEQGIAQSIQITEDAMNSLCDYDWPGNIRELQNMIERAIVYIDGEGIITSDCLPSRLKNATENKGNLKELEKVAIIRTIAKHRGNIAKAAEELGIHRSTLYLKLDRLGIPH